MIDRALIEGALKPVASTEVAHYTRLATLPHLLPHGQGGWASAWATPVQFLNDRRELALGLEVLLEVADAAPKASRRLRNLLSGLLATLGRPELDAYQMSFSGNADDLGQWRGYAANGMGCALVTEASAVRTKVPDGVAGWVIYRRKDQQTFARKVKEGLRGPKAQLDVEQTLVAAACFMKDEGFSPEQEFRLVCFAQHSQVGFRESGDRVVPYIDFLQGHSNASLPLHKVVVGPGWQLAQLSLEDQARHHVMLGIRRLLDARGLSTVQVIPSAIPFDPR